MRGGSPRGCLAGRFSRPGSPAGGMLDSQAEGATASSAWEPNMLKGKLFKALSGPAPAQRQGRRRPAAKDRPVT